MKLTQECICVSLRVELTEEIQYEGLSLLCMAPDLVWLIYFSASRGGGGRAGVLNAAQLITYLPQRERERLRVGFQYK